MFFKSRIHLVKSSWKVFGKGEAQLDQTNQICHVQAKPKRFVTDGSAGSGLHIGASKP